MSIHALTMKGDEDGWAVNVYALLTTGVNADDTVSIFDDYRHCALLRVRYTAQSQWSNSCHQPTSY